jgi:hypothetical protein
LYVGITISLYLAPSSPAGVVFEKPHHAQDPTRQLRFDAALSQASYFRQFLRQRI